MCAEYASARRRVLHVACSPPPRQHTCAHGHIRAYYSYPRSRSCLLETVYPVSTRWSTQRSAAVRCCTFHRHRYASSQLQVDHVHGHRGTRGYRYLWCLLHVLMIKLVSCTEAASFISNSLKHHSPSIYDAFHHHTYPFLPRSWC